MVHKTEQNCKPLLFVHCGSIPDNKNVGRCGQKKKADLKRNRLLAKDCNLDGICARERCAVLTRYSPLKNCDIMEVLYSNIPSAMR